MLPLSQYTGLYTDYYELTMAQGYFLNGMKDTPVVFDYFFRKCPYEGSYVVFSGLQEMLETLTAFSFGGEAIQYLAVHGFDHRFLDWLKNFRFTADVFSVMEGELVFPYEPCIRIEGNIIECQLVETLLLNVINFESLIATKAARIKRVAGNRQLMDFGFRRAQGLGGIQASRAAVAGGFNRTSNLLSAFQHGLEPSGTMAHSWIQAFEDEYTAFRVYADLYPESCVFLVDTYDTLKSGLPNAIKVALEMKARGVKLLGIRLDSGDLSYLSKKARRMLDDAGLQYVQIIVSNQLDEYVIKSLLEQSAPIDGFGIGTAIASGKDSGALDGVYKLSMINDSPTFKRSENPTKTTFPGKKVIYRYADQNGLFQADAVALESEGAIERILHPFETGKQLLTGNYQREELIHKVMEHGKIIIEKRAAVEAAEYLQSRIKQLPGEHTRLLNPHIYKVGISPGLYKLINEMH
jgi:nicotinate phosphoribosyltransferase